ncbi:MAG: transglycosylase SLT domain-containing protein, partial [Pseudobdellovibrio sp.]
EYKSFKADVKNKLPEWKKHFIEYSEKYQVPWTLIAAVAYQESKWQADAKSHTGVKGFMQLTSETAQHLGVEDREDPIQSIQGGSYYLKYLYDKTPQKLTRFERWIQALAAYNVGYAHLKDIHRLAKIQNTDSYRWINLKNLLPELSNKENLEIFQYGLARGEETVEFIENVLNYHEALNHIFTQRSQTSRDF